MHGYVRAGKPLSRFVEKNKDGTLLSCAIP